MAPLNETILKPGITSAISQKNAPFRIIPKIPSVRILIGNVRSEMIGFITKFTNIRQAPTTKITYVGFAETVFGNTYVVIKIAIESMSQCQMIFIELVSELVINTTPHTLKINYRLLPLHQFHLLYP